MDRERGSAMLVVVLALSFLLHCQAATFQVGDASGWNLQIGNWAAGKNFKAGDILEFKYDSSQHNVAVLTSESDFNSCNVPPNAQILDTGDDKITLKAGKNYFVCAIPGHCDRGMKILANAA